MRKSLLQFVILLLVALGAGPVGAAMWQWSKTASTNDSADPTINWREGMAPSSVNDSARAMMAAMAQYRDDISGLLATAGGPVAYTVTTNQGLASVPNDGQMLSFTINTTNGTSPTLQADGGTTYPIQSSPGVAVASASLVSGSPYVVKFSTANSAWMLKGFYSSPTNVALGALVPYTLTTSPNSNFIFAYGQCVSTTTYAAYWAALGSPASGSCPGGQFAVFDARGYALVGLDTMPGSAAANRLTSSILGCGTAMTSVGATCANGAENHVLSIAEMPAHSHANSLNDPGHSHGTNKGTSGLAANAALVAQSGGIQYINTTGENTSASGTGMTITNSGTGGGSAHPIVQPSKGVTYLLRVL